MQRGTLGNKNKNKTTTTTNNKNKTATTAKHQQQKEEKEDYSPRVKSLKDFVQLLNKKSSYLKNPLINKNKE
jgi:uncharacterized FlaG/YvyC family protein